MLGLPAPQRAKRPIVEIIGPVDCGKKAVAQLLARQLRGAYLSFPNLDLSSGSGRALFERIVTEPAWLEAHPDWWGHQSLCGMLERLDEIESHRAVRPLIVTNYLAAAGIWMRAAGGPPNLQGWAGPLPQPDYVFALDGEAWANPGNVPAQYSPELLERVNALLAKPGDRRIIRIPLAPGHRMRHTSINDGTENIASLLHLKCGLQWQRIEYDRDDFARRKK